MHKYSDKYKITMVNVHIISLTGEKKCYKIDLDADRELRGVRGCRAAKERSRVVL